MAYISFIAILLGIAGIVGGNEAENQIGTITAALIHIGGIAAMVVTVSREKEEDGGD